LHSEIADAVGVFVTDDTQSAVQLRELVGIEDDSAANRLCLRRIAMKALDKDHAVSFLICWSAKWLVTAIGGRFVPDGHQEATVRQRGECRWEIETRRDQFIDESDPSNAKLCHRLNANSVTDDDLAQIPSGARDQDVLDAMRYAMLEAKLMLEPTGATVDTIAAATTTKDRHRRAKALRSTRV
jgi:hypothetical protein